MMNAVAKDSNARRLTIDQHTARRDRLDRTESPHSDGAIMVLSTSISISRVSLRLSLVYFVRLFGYHNAHDSKCWRSRDGSTYGAILVCIVSCMFVRRRV